MIVRMVQSRRQQNTGRIGNYQRPHEIQVRFRAETLTWVPMNEMRQPNLTRQMSQLSHGGFQTHYDVADAWCQRSNQSTGKVSNSPRASRMQETRTTFWHDAVEKQVKRIHKAMQVFDWDITEAMKRLIGYKQINCHMVFDVKMACVVTRESIWIGFLVAALNDLCIMAADIGNAYLNAECQE
jgi:hypothetical protein